MTETFEAHLPRQMYGYNRSDVKLLVVSDYFKMNSRLTDIADYVSKGDLLVFNNSKLIPSSLDVYSDDFQRFASINVGTDREGERFLLEVRPKKFGSVVSKGSKFSIIGSTRSIKLLERHENFSRYWWGELDDESTNIDRLLQIFGRYIRYDHIPFELPREMFDGVFYKVPGSVELPSASYPFDLDTLSKLEMKGVNKAEVTLHCNLGSLEYEEFKGKEGLLTEHFEVPLSTLAAVKDTKDRGRMVIAVGTTVVRALETLALNYEKASELTESTGGTIKGGIEGSTNIYIDRSHTLKIVDALITGMHEGDGSHIRMLDAFQTSSKMAEAYGLAQEWGFQYHEFGDLALVFKHSERP